MNYLVALVALASCLMLQHASGLPQIRGTSDNGTPTEKQILNFALTLEHLENAFYMQALEKYSQKDFLDENLPVWARGRWEQIAQHEATHVSFLETALGDEAVKPCTYNFPDTDPKTFAELSFMFETVGVSAYSGAAKFLTNPDTITSSGAILAVEARQSAWIHSAVQKANPWNSAFDTPLDLNQVFTLASGVIVSCPPTNMPLPVRAFPALVFPASARPGQTVEVTFNATSSAESLYVGFISGLGATIVPLEPDRTVTIPSNLQGVVFGIVVTSETKVTDDVTVAGPVFLSFDFDSED
ncbi:ferritin-like domain-containing protein [Phlebopus sp. FC_14]|nr:ferritin-like domain-containing protein [Phlebopus sp. FC_14]